MWLLKLFNYVCGSLSRKVTCKEAKNRNKRENIKDEERIEGNKTIELGDAPHGSSAFCVLKENSSVNKSAKYQSVSTRTRVGPPTCMLALHLHPGFFFDHLESKRVFSSPLFCLCCCFSCLGSPPRAQQQRKTKITRCAAGRTCVSSSQTPRRPSRSPSSPPSAAAAHRSA